MTDYMPKAIEQLQLDHRNMTRLLDVLREEFEAYRGGRGPDFDLLNSIMEYTLHYPDLFHHPKENLIYQRMVKRDPTVRSMVGDLLYEHVRLGELTHRLAAAINIASRDSEVPREWLDGVVASYLTSNYRHMATEEHTFFPRAIAVLQETDWAEIDATLDTKEDPLFGGKVAKEYSALCERIMRAAIDVETLDFHRALNERIMHSIG